MRMDLNRGENIKRPKKKQDDIDASGLHDLKKRGETDLERGYINRNKREEEKLSIQRVKQEQERCAHQ